MPNDTILAALSCKIIPTDDLAPMIGFWKPIKITCQSTAKEASFTLETNPLAPPLLDKFKQLERWGFTVVELDSDWQWKPRSAAGTWKDDVIMRALEQVSNSIQKHGEQTQMAGYDKELAREVLLHLDKIFPDTLSNMQLKHQLSVEPSDAILLAALEALRKQGFIEGHEKRENTTGAHRLIALKSIGITPAGQNYLEGQSPASPVANYYINHGQAGAMGPNSSGTINYQQQYSQVENEINLSAIADQFEKAINQRMALSPSSSDFAELQLMAQAKEQAQKHEGGKLMETVSLIGKTAVPILTSAGAHALVSWLELKLGTKLS